MLKLTSKKHFFAGIIFMILLGATSVFAQSGVTVSGMVKDQNDAIVQGATVKLLNLGNNVAGVFTTDSTGKYEFNNVGNGSYRLSASRDGFTSSGESIRVTGENISQDFALSPGSISDVVTITAGKGEARVASEVPQTVTVVTSEQIEQQRPRSTFEAFERAPNVIVRETNPARERPRLRGLDSSRVLIVIDGEKLNNARTDLQTGLSPSIIDVTQLASVEVIGGAGSSLYGSDSLAGTINLITRGPERPDKGANFGLRFDGNYSSNGEVARGNLVANLSNKFVAFRAGYSQFSLKDYTLGGNGISRDVVLAAGRFYQSIPTALPNAAGVFATNTAPGFPIFSVPKGSKILNGGGRGVGTQFDMWFFPSEKLNVRGRYIDSQHRDLGDAFSGPPYETQQRFNSYRDYSKLGFRMESLGLANWLPRLAVNFYRQRLSFPQDQYEYVNQARTAVFPNGSYTGNVFTGNDSTFTLNTFTGNKNTITTINVDVQGTLQPFAGLLVTVGAQNLKDNSRDEFSNFGFFNFDYTRPNLTPTAGTFSFNGQNFTAAAFQTGAGSPNTIYRDRAAFFQAEFDRIKWFRLTGGLRVDKWQTVAVPSNSFPLRNESGILAAAIPALTANPGSLSSVVSALPSLLALANRTGTARTDNTVMTGSIGGVLRLPYGINPYIRYGTSYREPSITERYIIRNFAAFPGLTPIVLGNPNLESERGKTLDVGVKVQGSRYNGSFGYFTNNLKNLNVFRSPDFGNICVAPNPAIGLLPLSAIFAPSAPPCAIGQSAINVNARINLGAVKISGIEGTGEFSVPFGSFGSLNPFVSFGTLRGENKSPTAVDLFIIDRVFNNPNTLVELQGSRDDVPLGNITPFRLIGGASFVDTSGRLFLEYSFRHQSRVKRVNPTFFNGATLVNYGTLASLNAFTKINIKGGYTFRTERYRMSFNAGIDNLTNKLYFEHFQNAPAPGRSFVFGITTELFNLLGNK